MPTSSNAPGGGIVGKSTLQRWMEEDFPDVAARMANDRPSTSELPETKDEGSMSYREAGAHLEQIIARARGLDTNERRALAEPTTTGFRGVNKPSDEYRGLLLSPAAARRPLAAVPGRHRAAYSSVSPAIRELMEWCPRTAGGSESVRSGRRRTLGALMTMMSHAA